MRYNVPSDLLAAWCRAHLGSEPVETLFQAGYISTVVGVRLTDGREVVLKARPPAERLAGCTEVQRALSQAGFPCPEPITGPAALGNLALNAEVYVPGGETLEPGPDSPRLFAEALARLVALAPPPAAVSTLDPPPPWAWPDYSCPDVWPPADDTPADLNAHQGPSWLEEVGQRARERLKRTQLPHVIGHCDWESQR